MISLACLGLALAAEPKEPAPEPDPAPGRPAHTLFLPFAEPAMPHPGQEHPQGHLGRKSRLAYIPMWTQNDLVAPETLVRTTPVEWPAGGGKAIVQIWHRSPKGKHILTVRVTTPDGVEETPVEAERIRAKHEGGVQSVVVPFETSKAGNVSVEVVADGGRRVHIGTVHLADKKPRPFWIFQHCVNSRRVVRATVKRGANAAEVDIVWSRGELLLIHPPPRPTSCWATKSKHKEVPKFFAELAKYSKGPDAPIALISLDVKDPDKNTEAYANALARELLAAGVPAEKTMLMGPHDTAEPFVHALQAAGYPIPHVDAYHDLMKGKLPDDWVEQSVDGGATFLGIGADPMAFWVPTPKYAGPLKQVIDRRDAGGPPYYAYFWTLARRASFRFALDAGVDGVIANKAQHMVPELARPPYDELYYLAKGPPVQPPGPKEPVDPEHDQR